MKKPWYKQFWPWFLMAIPATSIIYSLSIVYVFSQNQVDLVAEDYYKKGKAINLDLSRLKVADALKLKASLQVVDDEITLNFDKGELTQYPNLRVTFTHRTLADRDFTQMVSADLKGSYHFNTAAPVQGPWFVEVEPFEGDWMLQGPVALPTPDPISLYGQIKE